MKKLIVVVITIAFVLNTFAKEEKISNEKNELAQFTELQNLTGKVIDNATGESLAGVEVRIYGTNIQTYTDFDGNFEFTNIPSGAQAVVANYISYQQMVKNVYVNNQDNNSLVIRLISKK